MEFNLIMLLGSLTQTSDSDITPFFYTLIPIRSHISLNFSFFYASPVMQFMIMIQKIPYILNSSLNTPFVSLWLTLRTRLSCSPLKWWLILCLATFIPLGVEVGYVSSCLHIVAFRSYYPPLTSPSPDSISNVVVVLKQAQSQISLIFLPLRAESMSSPWMWFLRWLDLYLVEVMPWLFPDSGPWNWKLLHLMPWNSDFGNQALCSPYSDPYRKKQRSPASAPTTSHPIARTNLSVILLT